MAEQKKPSKLAAITWSALTLGLLARTFYRPQRAVVAKGYAVGCPGKVSGTCKPELSIQGSPGAVPIYAVTSGAAAIASDGSLSIASDREPIVVSYGKGPEQLLVRTGEHVGLGQQVGFMSKVAFSVTEIVRDGAGGVTFRPIEPASWLAARGLRIAQSGNVPSDLWCSHGRTISVPSASLSCVRLPEPSALMLLPVSVTTS